MTNILIGFILIAIALIVWASMRSKKTKSAEREKRLQFIERYVFPAALKQKLYERFPDLNTSQIEQILEGLRQWFFLLAQHHGQKFGMPSKAVDAAWHEFILMTRQYESFCKDAFGKYLHHSPNEGGDERQREDIALARTYALAPATAVIAGGAMVGGAAAVGLFDIDRSLGIEGGFQYDDATRDEMMKRHASQQGGGDGGSYSVSDSGSREHSGGHGLDSGDAGSGSDGGGGCGGGGCGS